MKYLYLFQVIYVHVAVIAPINIEYSQRCHSTMLWWKDKFNVYILFCCFHGYISFTIKWSNALGHAKNNIHNVMGLKYLFIPRVIVTIG
jgi:hypothetical protein